MRWVYRSESEARHGNIDATRQPGRWHRHSGHTVLLVALLLTLLWNSHCATESQNLPSFQTEDFIPILMVAIKLSPPARMTIFRAKDRPLISYTSAQCVLQHHLWDINLMPRSFSKCQACYHRYNPFDAVAAQSLVEKPTSKQEDCITAQADAHNGLAHVDLNIITVAPQSVSSSVEIEKCCIRLESSCRCVSR